MTADFRRVVALERVVAEVQVRGEKIKLGSLTESITEKIGAYCRTTGWTQQDRSGRVVWAKEDHEVWEPMLADPPYRLHYLASAGIEDIAIVEERSFLSVLVDVLTLD